MRNGTRSRTRFGKVSMNLVVYGLVLVSLVMSFLHRRTSGLATFELIIGSLLVVVVFICFLRYTFVRIRIPKPIRYLAIFGIVVLLNYVVALRYGVSTVEWVRKAFLALLLPLFTIASLGVGSPKRLVGLYRLITVMCMAVVIYSILQIPRDLSSLSRVSAIRGAVEGTSLFIPYLAYASGFLVCMSFPVLMTERSARAGRGIRAFYIGGFVLGNVGLVLSLSRTFWGATFAALVAMGIAISRGSTVRLRMRLMTGVLGVVIVLGGVVAGTPLKRFVYQRTTVLGSTLDQRIHETVGVFSSMGEEPMSLLTGMGFGNEFRMYSVSRHASAGLGEIDRSYSHNHYVYLLWTTGIVGCGVMAAFLVSFWRVLLRGISASKLKSEHATAHSTLVGIFGASLIVAIASLTTPAFGMLTWVVVIGAMISIGCALERSVISQAS